MENYYPIEFDDNGSSFTITNSGTAPTPCLVTIIPKVDLITLQIEGLSEEPIMVYRVKANSVLVIDGEKGQVTVDDIPCFFANTYVSGGETYLGPLYDSWEFPKLQPGVNHIDVTNGRQCSIAVEFQARYI